MSDSCHNTGQWAEELAQDHLCRHGLRPGMRNYRFKGGEIDLIMRHDDTLVFVEVRYRSRSDYGCSAETIDRRKRTRIISTAQHYLQNHRHDANRPCRFDVIAISGPKGQHKVQWIQSAFD